MNRRNFISLSSATLAGVMFSRLTAWSAESGSMISNPKSVLLLLDTGWVKLVASGVNHYRYRDAALSLQAVNGATSVYLRSPTLPVKAIRLVWQYEAASGARCLADHWERTYGDMGWTEQNPNKKSPWYLLLHDGATTTCFGVKTGAKSICWWNVGPRTLQLTMDTQSAGIGVSLGNRQLHAADIVTTKNLPTENVFGTTQRFCTLMCDKPLLPAEPVYGINDWYYAYGNNSPELILQQTRLMAELVTSSNNRPFSVIDAGWAAYSPLLVGDCCWQDDFSRPNDKFKDMQKMASDIRAAGMRPGLWTRPLCARYNDAAGLLLPKIEGRNNPKNPVLDPSIQENIERVKNNIAMYRQWGFELVKHDFSTFDITGRWGFQMTDNITEPGWRFYDNTRTTAEIINHLYQAIRQAAGDMYLIGCNTLSHLSAGVFELNRIGDDTSGKEWARTPKMGVNTLGFRIAQHKAFYAADGDCVGLTKEVPWEKNKQWMQLLAESGTPTFISAQPDALGTEQRQFVRACFTQAAKWQPTGEPLDWMENQRPALWKLNERELRFNWA